MNKKISLFDQWFNRRFGVLMVLVALLSLTGTILCAAMVVKTYQRVELIKSQPIIQQTIDMKTGRVIHTSDFLSTNGVNTNLPVRIIKIYE